MIPHLIIHLAVTAFSLDTGIVPDTGRPLYHQKKTISTKENEDASHLKIPLNKTLNPVPPNSTSLLVKFEGTVTNGDETDWKLLVIRNLGRGSGVSRLVGSGQRLTVHYKGNQRIPTHGQVVRIMITEVRRVSDIETVEFSTYGYSSL